MRMNKSTIHTFTCLLFLAMTTISCQEVVSPKGLVSQGNKLVVNSLIHPESEKVEVEVSRSKPILGTIDFNQSNDDIVTNAVVTISDADNEAMLIFDSSEQKYSILTTKFPIIEGTEYTLNVSHKNETVSASCTVPKTVATDNIYIEDSYGNAGYTVNIEWNATSAITDYFHVKCNYFIHPNLDPSSPGGEVYFYTNFEEFVARKNNKSDLLRVTEYVETPKKSKNNREIELILISADEHYYKYQKQLLEVSEGGGRRKSFF